MCFYCAKLLLFKQWKSLNGDTVLIFDILYWIYIYKVHLDVIFLIPFLKLYLYTCFEVCHAF